MTTSVRQSTRILFACALPLAVVSALPGCSQAEEPYKPAPAFSGRKASLPGVPTLPAKAVKAGDAYTVYGAMHHLRSRVHNAEVNAKDIAITGYIVKTNLAEAPACAVHKTGKGDKDDCKAPIPAFWIADEKGDDKNAVKVMGWASNFAQIFDASEKYAGPKGTSAEAVKDEFWAVDVPNPVPNVGAKVTVSGNFGVSFTKSTSGVETDPSHGIMTYAKLTYVEPPSEPGTLPGGPGAKAGKKK
ncbi:MAG TPA: hypothetical protein VJT73_21535 [Polyangiaceae bacterium]|nr:hypothetical protein [Polyangiaceae bacterium]